MLSPAATIAVATDRFNAGHMQEGARLVYTAAFTAVADAAARWNIPCRNDHEARDFLLRLEGFDPGHLDWTSDFEINTPIRAPRYMAAFDVASSFKEHADTPLAQQAKDPVRYWEPAHFATFVPPVRELIEALDLVNPDEVKIWTRQPTSEKHAII